MGPPGKFLGRVRRPGHIRAFRLPGRVLCRRLPGRQASAQAVAGRQLGEPFFNEGQLAFEQTGLLLQPLPLDGRVGCHGLCGKSRTALGGVDPVAVAAAATGKTPIPGETTAAESRAEAAARLTTGKTRLNVPRAEARPPSGHGAFAHRSCSISSWHVSSSSVVYGVCPDRTTFSRPDRSHWLRPDHPSGLARVHRSCPRYFAKGVRLQLFFVAAPHR